MRVEAETDRIIARGLKRSLFIIAVVGLGGAFFYDRLKKSKFEGKYYRLR